MKSRIGAIALILAFGALSATMPDRYRIAPVLVYADVGLMIVAMLVAATAAPASSLRRIEHAVMLAAVTVAFIINALSLFDILDALMYHPATLKPLPLFFTSASIWTANICVFTLLYWLIDRGGPDARAAGTGAYPDFDFPAMSDASKVPPNWQPGIIDYFFIGFTANTAFGPTEAMPLTERAKLLVILQSLVSLITIVVVAARAIGATG